MWYYRYYSYLKNYGQFSRTEEYLPKKVPSASAVLENLPQFRNKFLK